MYGGGPKEPPPMASKVKCKSQHLMPTKNMQHLSSFTPKFKEFLHNFRNSRWFHGVGLKSSQQFSICVGFAKSLSANFMVFLNKNMSRFSLNFKMQLPVSPLWELPISYFGSYHSPTCGVTILLTKELLCTDCMKLHTLDKDCYCCIIMYPGLLLIFFIYPK